MDPLPLADQAGRLEAAHLGHVHVHQHQVEALLLHRLDRFAPVLRHPHRVPALGQDAERQLLVDRVVLRQEDAEPAAVPRAPRASAGASAAPRSTRPSAVITASSSSDCRSGLVT